MCVDPDFKIKHYTSCSSKMYKGDGICDDGNNNPGCEYDGGDCCVKSLGAAVQTQYCQKVMRGCLHPIHLGIMRLLQCLGCDMMNLHLLQCECLDPNPKAPKPKCAHAEYKGDGICDDGNNHVDCDFDGGDCCDKSLGSPVNKKYCTVCKCLDPSPKAPKPKCAHTEYKGDGICDDGLNNVDCDFDGGLLVTKGLQ